MRLTDGPEHGTRYAFRDAHIYYFLTVLNKDRSISRGDISEITGIGEGSIRSITDLMRSWRAATVDRTGIRISEHGIKLLNDIPISLTDIGRSEYVLGTHQRGVLIRGGADRITDGMRQRDKGLVAGADGASVFVMRNGKVIMPKAWDMDTRAPEFAKRLRDSGMGEGDAMIICGADEPSTAVLSAISVALDIL